MNQRYRVYVCKIDVIQNNRTSKNLSQIRREVKSVTHLSHASGAEYSVKFKMADSLELPEFSVKTETYVVFRVYLV